MKKLLVFSLSVLFACNSKDEIKFIGDSKNIHPVSLTTPLNDTKVYNPKILPFLETIDRKLKAGEINSYDWYNNCSCNVGLMAQCVSGVGAKEIKTFWDSIKDYNSYADGMQKKDKGYSTGAWSNMIDFYCGISNKHGFGIIKELQDAGFSSSDIQGLEYLSDTYILSKSDIKTTDQYYADKNNLIKYLDAWISIINSNQQKQPTSSHNL